jgi:protein TonB
VSDYQLSFVIALLAHIGILSLDGVTLVEQAEYGIGAAGGSRGPIGVELVERAPKAVEVLTPTAEHTHQVKEPPPIQPRKDDIVVPSKLKKKKVPEVVSEPLPPKGVPAGEGGTVVGTGEGSQAGGSGSGDGLISASPAYYRNPAPIYPRAARERRIEGVVRLLVDVNETGAPTAVKVKESSGYTMLDRAAEDAVHRWRFRPARRLGRNVSSQVEIPIRFKLEQ